VIRYCVEHTFGVRQLYYATFMTMPMPTSSASLIKGIRSSSRQLVRQLGFMGGRFAGTDLHPSAVHALIEIEQGSISARDLGASLNLDKSTVSRMLARLAASGHVREEASAEDARIKVLSLTEKGKCQVDAIHRSAHDQVAAALARLSPSQGQTVLEGLHLYASALCASASPTGPVEIVPGYRTGIIARVTQMHATYYARETGFGQRFESVVAGGLAGFCDRLGNPRNQIWVARQAGHIIGSIAIDAEDMGDGIAHLRWFIVDDGVRGTGAGRKLLSEALAFVDDHDFAETHLWTFSGLAAARHLYEAGGFSLTEERNGTQWGSEVLEQRFVRPRQ